MSLSLSGCRLALNTGLGTRDSTRHINSTGQALLKFVMVVSPLYLSGYTQILVHC